MTIYKLSEFLFKEQGQLLLSLDLVSYGNLDKKQCASQKLKEERLGAEWVFIQRARSPAIPTVGPWLQKLDWQDLQ